MPDDYLVTSGAKPVSDMRNANMTMLHNENVDYIAFTKICFIQMYHSSAMALLIRSIEVQYNIMLTA